MRPPWLAIAAIAVLGCGDGSKGKGNGKDTSTSSVSGATSTSGDTNSTTGGDVASASGAGGATSAGGNSTSSASGGGVPNGSGPLTALCESFCDNYLVSCLGQANPETCTQLCSTTPEDLPPACNQAWTDYYECAATAELDCEADFATSALSACGLDELPVEGCT